MTHRTLNYIPGKLYKSFHGLKIPQDIKHNIFLNITEENTYRFYCIEENKIFRYGEWFLLLGVYDHFVEAK